MLARGRVSSMILWGPPGVGKTTIARLLAHAAGLEYEAVSAVFSGVADLRKVFDRAEARRAAGQPTLLFVDEIHRFNRAQQDAFLPFVERGTVVLVGATTENPSFEVNAALLSRLTVLTLRPLDEAALSILLDRALETLEAPVPLADDARALLLRYAGGDGRHLLGLVEQLGDLAGDGQPIEAPALAAALQRRATAHDKDREAHYDLISALHKAIRGSDVDAALFWLARMLEGGEDGLFIARRLIRAASEDIGTADPLALLVAEAARTAWSVLGPPEAELHLAQAVTHLAAAPKSNAVYVAWKAARRAAREHAHALPPLHARNAPTRLMTALGYGDGYVYDHDEPGGVAGLDYLPDGMERPDFYRPTGRGAEARIAERIEVARQARARRRKAARARPVAGDA